MSFSKMEQAERWEMKLRFLADQALNEKDDVDAYNKYMDQADRLDMAREAVRRGNATPKDWKVFNAAIAKRDLADVLL